jgi:hypothetical protein
MTAFVLHTIAAFLWIAALLYSAVLANKLTRWDAGGKMPGEKKDLRFFFFFCVGSAVCAFTLQVIA